MVENEPFRKNLIGKKVNVDYQGKVFNGVVILETKNTLKIRTKEKELIIMKQTSKISIDDKEINIIQKRTEDRIKSR